MKFKKKKYNLVLVKTSDSYIPSYLINLFLKRERLILYYKDKTFFKNVKQKYRLKFQDIDNKEKSFKLKFRKTGYTVSNKNQDTSKLYPQLTEIESIEMFKCSNKEMELKINFSAISRDLYLYLFYDKE